MLPDIWNTGVCFVVLCIMKSVDDLKLLINNEEKWMEITLSLDRYTIMEHVSQQAGEFRMAEMYFLLKGMEPERWQAVEVKITLEWLADMGLVKRKLVKAGHGQKWLFYQACYDYEFLFSRTELFCDMKIVKYKCRGNVERIRCLLAQINEKAYRKREIKPCKYIFFAGL